MFKNRDRGLSNTLYWFFEVRNRAYMENYVIVLRVKLKINSEHFKQRFSVHSNREQTCLSEILLISETSARLYPQLFQ